MKRDSQKTSVEETLDPKNWEELRTLGHRMLDDMLDFTKKIRSQPTLTPTKKAIEEICVPLSNEGEGEERVYEVFRQSILPYTLITTTPRFWGVVAGQGSPYGMLCEMLRAGMNGTQEFSFSEAKVNMQAISWIKEMLGFPKETSGVLVSGGSEANFTALAVARNSKANANIKGKGIIGLQKKLTLYCGDETHHCLERSVELLGLGNEALRKIPTDNNCKILLSDLKTAIKKDREQDRHPFCIIGCAGTTNTGAFDDLNALADIAKKENMWFHIDGAFGAWVKISRTHKHLANGMERADSLAVDLHKWMNMPYGIGCTLVKNRLAHFSTFVYGHEAEYLKSAFEISEDQLTNPHNLALPLSRSFSSLKVYMLLRAYGKNKYSNLVQQNLDQIKYLAELIQQDQALELAFPVTSNIVCFRFKPPELKEADLKKLNKMILDELNKKAFLMISDTTVKGKYVLRACNVNHRTKKQDMATLVDQIKKIGYKHLSLI